MIKKSVLLLAVVILGMKVTNPDQERYLDHTLSTLKDRTCINQDLPLTAKLNCGILYTVPRNMGEGLVKNYTRQQDYFLFSIYTTNLGGLKHRSIGILGQFLSL